MKQNDTFTLIEAGETAVSLGITTVGQNISKGIGMLQAAGANTNWILPKIRL